MTTEERLEKLERELACAKRHTRRLMIWFPVSLVAIFAWVFFAEPVSLGTALAQPATTAPALVDLGPAPATQPASSLGPTGVDRGNEPDAWLSEAIEKNDLDGVKSALKAGANPNKVSETRRPYTVLGHSLLESSSPYYRDESQCMLVLQTLFDAGARYQAQYDDPMLFFPISNGLSKVVALLLDKGADPSASVDGVSLVELSESYGADEVTSILVKHGAAPIPRREAAELRLVQCAADGDYIGVKKAIEEGASVHTKSKISDETGLTAAMQYPSGEKCAIVDYLLAKGANPNQQGGDWGTPLHALMYYSSVVLQDEFSNSRRLRGERAAATAMFDVLLKAGAHVSARNEKGETPLHIAARWNNEVLARKLIEAGAKIMDRDNEGKTPLDYAESAEMIRMLKSYGAKEQ